MEQQQDQINIQQHIERQLGQLLVQICVKDATIEKLQAEINMLKIRLGDFNGGDHSHPPPLEHK
jgi:hypothetical protein